MPSCEALVNTRKADASLAVPGLKMGQPVSAGTGVQSIIELALGELPADSSGLVLAYSGGVDSHVLLQCVSDWCLHQTSQSLRAHHVNHSLQSSSGEWAAHCDTVCRQLGVELTVSCVTVDLASGYSPEEAARRARYEALENDLQTGEVLLTAHHADDQAETLLLQLFRGAGVNGLAAMPRCTIFGPGHLARPMLPVSAGSVREFAQSRQLHWIEDPSNHDDDFDRNLLRNQVMPLLEARWPSIAASISRSASHCAEAATINRVFANRVLGEKVNHLTLSLDTLKPLSVIEKKAVLRCWLEHHGVGMPSTVKLNHLLADLVDAPRGSSGDIFWGRSRIRRYRDNLFLGRREAFEPCPPFCYEWSDLQLPLIIEETGEVLSERDIPAAHVHGELTVRSRQGGESIRLSGHQIHKSVKKLYQECAIPPWRRDRLPFIYRGNRLVGIVGIGFTD